MLEKIGCGMNRQDESLQAIDEGSSVELHHPFCGECCLPSHYGTKRAFHHHVVNWQSGKQLNGAAYLVGGLEQAGERAQEFSWSECISAALPSSWTVGMFLIPCKMPLIRGDFTLLCKVQKA